MKTLPLALMMATILCGSMLFPKSAVAQTDPQQVDKSDDASPLAIRFVRIPAGTFMRGFDNSDRNEQRFHLDHPYSNHQDFKFERPSHRVELTKAFEIADCEVTVGQFREFVEATGYRTDAEKNGGALGWFPDEDNYVDRFHADPAVTWQSPGFEQSDRHPVVAVSWNDAQAFCRWLSEQDGRNHRLPSEAEWEYACRSGTTTWYSFGNDPDLAYAHGNVADGALEARFPNTARYTRAVRLTAGEGDGHVFTAPVRSFKANAWGLHDLHGNVWEWCQDRWAEDAYDRYLSGISRREREQFVLKDPVFDEATDLHQYGDWRVMRGGAWTCTPAATRASIRTFAEKADSSVYTGFRIVREVNADAK
ncbi:formylglycine-generating enzyme family protein [Stieleria sp. JC731]|uniref:formylglycine-generating enzyme family protein n=1 Tax=Pirellulaceae TaxID=2691357 RepID=UPI001E35BE52|nr:formylglycine-generating enzyme family protein [Stieleria sp. JC731]MCC9599857.1 formylglycine-generating enzyme family protein [Stieleria sp. JC731]